MRKYQVLNSNNDYAISDFGKRKIDFATNKDFSIKYKKLSTIETESALKPAFKDFLYPIYTKHGVFPIFNYKGEQCEQIVNIPTRILSTKEILEYLNTFTILPQSTPPWDEIIYKLTCFSETLTNEFFDKENIKFIGDESDIAAMFMADEDLRSEDDSDVHYFVTAPKIFEEKKGTVFHLPKPNRAHRKWVVLEEYYDYKNNAWIKDGKLIKRTKPRVNLIDKSKKLTKAQETTELERAKNDYFLSGGQVEKIDLSNGWRNLEIHELAHIIPYPSDDDRERLKEDIRLNGVLEPLTLYEGKILDGRTRQGICLELGIKPKYKDYDAKISPRAFVMSMGIPRRHLSSSQIAAFGVKELLPEYERKAKKRQQLNALNRSKKSNPVKLQGSEKGDAGELVAKALKTSSKYIYDAKKIKEISPILFKKILSGELTISKAKSQINSSIPRIKKKRKPQKFETKYRIALSHIFRTLETNILDIPYQNLYSVFHELSSIYLKWTKRNDKSLIKKLDELKILYPDIFSDKKERHLRILKQM